MKEIIYYNYRKKNIIYLLFIDGIVSTMRSKSGPSYRVLETWADYEKFLDNFEHSIVGKF